MASFSERLSLAILGDPLDAGLVARPIAYEDVHNDVQSILIPPLFPKGVNLQLLQSINKNFAMQHRIGLEPGQMKQTMFGPMPGPGNRYYSLGAVITHRSDAGGKYRVTGQYDAENAAGKCTAVGDVYGDGKVKLTLQAEDRKEDKAGSEWGVTAALRGDESVTVLRLKHGLEAGLSYNRRLTPTSPITVGGECFVDVRKCAAAATAAAQEWMPRKGGKGVGSEAEAAAAGSAAASAPAKPAPGRRPYDYALGLAYDTGLHKTALHFASTGSFPAVASVHHLYRNTERSSLAAKYMLNLTTGSTMAALGYKLRFRNTLSTLHGMADTYGTVRLMVEREPVKDVRIGLSFEGKLSPAAAASPGPDGPVVLGLQVSLGSTARIPQQQSPCMMSRTVFGLT